MLELTDMLLRIGMAILLGAVVGFERELVGKEAGIRTDIFVAVGAAIFSIVGLELPYLAALPSGGYAHLESLVEVSRGFTVIAGIVTGIGFLGAGIIIKQGTHVSGVTTAASIWFVAGVGMLCGIGLIKLAAIVSVAMVLILIALRKMDLFGLINKKERIEKFENDDV